MVQESDLMLDGCLSQVSDQSGGRLLQSAILRRYNPNYQTGCLSFASLLAISHLTNHGYLVAKRRCAGDDPGAESGRSSLKLRYRDFPRKTGTRRVTFEVALTALARSASKGNKVMRTTGFRRTLVSPACALALRASVAGFNVAREKRASAT